MAADNRQDPAAVEAIPSPILALVGDAVFHLHVRSRLAAVGYCTPASLHRVASRWVNAGAQAALLRGIEATLSPSEKDVVRRGRNATSGRAPRGVSVTAYRASSGLESLLGYLYLAGSQDRLQELLEALWDATQEPGEEQQ
jgi:ribonuclease-3 family protein